jgi:hypothetical protein
MNEFLNPKSMSTPGAAGALMMLMANALCSNFPECPFRYVALILSFAIGAVVFAASTMKVWERGIYWVVNSLIIFSMGATNIAANVAAKQASNEHATSVVSEVLSVFAGAAFAQDGKLSLPAASNPKNKAPVATRANQQKPSTKAESLVRIKALEEQVSELEAVNERLQQQTEAIRAPAPESKAPDRGQEVFFKRW